MPLRFPDQSCNEAIVLGAGFSRAISDAMPLTDEVGGLAIAAEVESGDSTLAGLEFSGGYFEAWLSRLAEDQPDLSAAENLANRSLFLRLKDHIYTSLRDRQRAVLADGLPEWLFDLLSVLHARRASVLTFNWDTLVEQAVDRRLFFDWSLGQRAQWVHLTDELPPHPPGPGRFGYDEAKTMRLLKLHGSLNWLWTSGDETGATLARWERPDPPFDPADEATRRRRFPGREPFVVPPSATKSAYFRNPLTREIWQQSAHALASATRVSLLGYSVPPTDLTAAGMIGDALRGRDVPVDVVNPVPEPVISQLRRLGVDEQRLHVVDSVESFNELHSRRAATDLAARLADHLRELPDNERDVPILVAVDGQAGGAAVAAYTNGGTLRLDTEPTARWSDATGRRQDHAPKPLTMGELADVASGSKVDVVEIGGATGGLVIAAAEGTQNTGYATRWQVLVPVGARSGPEAL